MTKTEFYALLVRKTPRIYEGLVTEQDIVISIQASKMHFCDPREDGHATYTHYEVWSEEPLYGLEDYQHLKGSPRQLYSYVPVEELIKELECHGKIQTFKQALKNTH
tara:strand:- start:694 stop:1014 length:321 start_codon:yes stop_codon:yes gene_type:complete